MRALVTGGAGFVGSALVERLLAEGHSVDVVDNLSTGSLANLAEARRSPGRRLTIHRVDVRSADIAELAARSRPEVVFHLAARTGARASVDDPVADAEVNVLGSVRVLEAARSCGARKVVFSASAGALYGEPDPADLPLKESHPRQPRSPHGVAVKAVADYLRAYREVHSLEFTALALASVYGPRQGAGGEAGVVATFAARLLAGEACTLYGDGGQTRDFVFVDDAVDAFARAAARGGGLLLNIGTGVQTSVDGLYRTMAGLVGSDMPAVLAPARSGDQRRICVDPGRAAIHLGWKPWTALEEGLAATIDWHRSLAGRPRP